ncbi:MAG: VOC family protein [Rhodothermales bacterium]
MSQPEHDKRLDYVEFAAADLMAVKQFYGDVFGWVFEDYGPEYTAFNDGRMTGGFWQGDAVSTGLPLVIMYALDLEAVEQSITTHGGTIVKETFSFPGGRRFHFADPCGNVLAVWTDRGLE